MKYGNLLVLEEVEPYYSPSGNKHTRYLCRCDCGKEKIVLKEHLISGATKSCGCLRHKKTYCEWRDMIGSRLYRVWGNMVNRCTNPNNPAYKNYGERGIKVCDEWVSFPNFRDWAEANGYADNLTLDRQDNNVGYNPNNCRWVDNFVQANNKRSNRTLTLDGETHTIAEWANILNVSYKALHHRVSLGWSDERALTQPYRKSPAKE